MPIRHIVRQNGIEMNEIRSKKAFIGGRRRRGALNDSETLPDDVRD